MAYLRYFFSTILTSCKKEEDDTENNPQLDAELTTRLDQIIDSTMHANNLPGVVVGIWIPNEGNYLKSFGKENLNLGTDRQFDAPFRIASLTKTFTATVILSFVDDGLLNTSNLLSEYLPNFPKANNITIRNLLRMRSGIVDFADFAILDEWYNNVNNYYDIDTLINIMASHGSEFIPAGQHTVYCNGNYTLLARVAEIVSGKRFADLVDEIILTPLKMTSTYYPETNDFLLSGTNRGYSWESTLNAFADKTELNTSCANAAGAIISNMNDLHIYARALYQGTLLSAPTQQKRLETEVFEGSPSIVQYGEGILKLGEFYGHNGTIFGFSTEMFYLPAKDAVIVINVNRLDLDDHSKSGVLFMSISKLVFPDNVNW